MVLQQTKLNSQLQTLDEYVNEIVRLRILHGFETSWENFAQKVMLVITELGRAVDADRDDDRNLAIHETIDGLIRLFDLVGSCDMKPEARLNRQLGIWRRTRLDKGPRHGKRY